MMDFLTQFLFLQMLLNKIPPSDNSSREKYPGRDKLSVSNMSVILEMEIKSGAIFHRFHFESS